MTVGLYNITFPSSSSRTIVCRPRRYTSDIKPGSCLISRIRRSRTAGHAYNSRNAVDLVIPVRLNAGHCQLISETLPRVGRASRRAAFCSTDVHRRLNRSGSTERLDPVRFLEFLHRLGPFSQGVLTCFSAVAKVPSLVGSLTTMDDMK